MKRTISIMLGKGSISHNSRQFKASNIDSDRTQFNVTYCNVSIKNIYHALFDDALRIYNSKQKRADRRIDNYYKKIRTGKQEKLFYEVVFQVGNMENMSSKSENGQLAATVLDDFMNSFQERNPYLKVFSAHLHMDEATPHLHVDFVPFTTGSKRGLDTRVSLKQALANQGFTGGIRGDTEWSQWVKSEKEQLAQTMAQHGIEWEQLGTHDEHLSVMDYKKVQRVKEIAALDENISQKQDALQQIADESLTMQAELAQNTAELNKVHDKLKLYKTKKKFMEMNVRHDDDPKFQLPVPKPMVSAKNYRDNVAEPLVSELKTAIRSILSQFFDRTQELKTALDRANRQVQGLSKRLEIIERETNQLRSEVKDYGRLRRGLGDERANEIIRTMTVQECIEKKKVIKREYVR